MEEKGTGEVEAGCRERMEKGGEGESGEVESKRRGNGGRGKKRRKDK